MQYATCHTSLAALFQKLATCYGSGEESHQQQVTRPRMHSSKASKTLLAVKLMETLYPPQGRRLSSLDLFIDHVGLELQDRALIGRLAV